MNSLKKTLLFDKTKILLDFWTLLIFHTRILSFVFVLTSTNLLINQFSINKDGKNQRYTKIVLFLILSSKIVFESIIFSLMSLKNLLYLNAIDGIFLLIYYDIGEKIF